LVYFNEINVTDVIVDEVGDADVVTEHFDRIIRHITYVKYKGALPA